MAKRCLIVDDDLTTLMIYKTILEDYFTCDVANNGEMALACIEQAQVEACHYHLVCLDINMPGTNGLTVLKQIRDMEKARVLSPDLESKVLIISSDSGSDTILNSFFECGASGYLTKPIDRLKLLGELKTLGLID